MDRKLFFSIALAIVLVSSTSSPVFAADIDTTKIGVEVGDWFVHEVVHGTDSIMGNYVNDEVAPGDRINTTITNITGSMIEVHTDFLGDQKDSALNMSNRQGSYIIHTDWDYWKANLDEVRKGTVDFLSDPDNLEEYEIAEASMNYSNIIYENTFNTTLEQYVVWDNGGVLDLVQQIDYDKATGVIVWVYVNGTGRDNANETLSNTVGAQRLVDHGPVPENLPPEDDEDAALNIPVPIWFASLAIMAVVRHRSRRRSD